MYIIFYVSWCSKFNNQQSILRTTTNIFIESVCCSEMYYIKGWLCILVEESMSEKQKRIKINIEMLLAGYARF